MARELSVEACATCAADPDSEKGYRSPHRWVPIGPATPDPSDELDLTDKDPT